MSSYSLKDVGVSTEPPTTSGPEICYSETASGPVYLDKTILHRVAFTVWQAALFLENQHKV